MKVCPVAGIIHPLEPRPRATLRIRRLIRQAKSHGWAAVALHVLGKITARTKALNRGGQMRPVDFSAGVVAYDRIPSSLIHTDWVIGRHVTWTQTSAPARRPSSWRSSLPR